ncbi:DUF2975 domain-containing protein [Flavobacterium sp.]|uniref:DUF2975 domain-containing protein n=1 Tax=Flavobacterium sp. TaxID=239 RepID=UPI004033E29C
MKRLSLLKTLVTILFVLAAIGFIFSIPTLLIMSIFPEMVPFAIDGTNVKEIGNETIIYFFVLIIGYAFFVYAAYLFKNVLGLFEKKKIFHDDVIKNFSQTGRAILIGGAITIGAKFLYGVVVEQQIELSASLDFDSSLFILGLGLFFLVLSDVFLMAKGLKEENDLTV